MDAVFRMMKPGWLSLPEMSLFLGGLCWVMSLTQVAFHTTHGQIMGYWVLATGWMGFALFQFAWYSNLLVLLAVLLMYRRPNVAMGLAVAGVLLAGQAFWFEDIPGQETSMHILRLGAGFWLWYSSIVLLVLGVIFGSGEYDQTQEGAPS